MRILVVDDDAEILKFVALLLRSDGREVVTASGPEDAKTLSRERAFDLLLTDIDMEGSPVGITLASDLMASSPTLRVILMSGSGPRQGIPPTLPFVAKPFTRAELVKVVAEVFREDPAGRPRVSTQQGPAA